MELTQSTSTYSPDEASFVFSQFLHYSQMLETESFSNLERDLILLYYLKLKELLDSFQAAHRLYKFG